MKLQFTIKNQTLYLSAAEPLVADSINYFRADFSFCDAEWNGLNKYAHFSMGDECYDFLLENDSIPASAGLNLKAGCWTVHLHGDAYENGELAQRITTASVSFTVKESGCLEGNAFPSVSLDMTSELLRRLSMVEDGVAAVKELPCVYLTGTAPTSKDDGAVPLELEYRSAGCSFHSYATLKVQGSSSTYFPKKNYTVKLYNDSLRTEKQKQSFRNWGEQHKFVLKANWLDITHSYNIVSARIWGDCVKARTDFSSLPALMQKSPNMGAVDGFLVKVYFNGIYQGRYTWNIPKDAWMANMNEDLDSHCILCGEDKNSARFRAAAKIDGSDWTDEIHDEVPESIRSRWNEVIDFVMNSSDTVFKEQFSEYFDLCSVIDYYLFSLLICHPDNFSQNQMYMTYDGQKWFASPYDMDCTWGINGEYESYLWYCYPFINYFDHKDGSSNLLYQRLQKLFTAEICSRYGELRQSVFSYANCMDAFESFMSICPKELVEEDYAETTADGAFTTMLRTDTNTIQRLREFMRMRMKYCDDYLANCNVEKAVVYSLPQATVFDGVDDFIDTGIQLFDVPKNFTLFMDVDSSANTVNSGRIFNCIKGSGGDYTGVELRHSTSASLLVPEGYYKQAGNWMFNNNIPSAERVKIAIVFQNGYAAGMRYKTASGSVVRVEAATTLIGGYYPHNNTLLLGCGRSNATTKSNFWGGTIHSFEVYNYELTPEEIDEKLLKIE